MQRQGNATLFGEEYRRMFERECIIPLSTCGALVTSAVHMGLLGPLDSRRLTHTHAHHIFTPSLPPPQLWKARRQ